MEIIRKQYKLPDGKGGETVYHFETDSKEVLMDDGKTLETELVSYAKTSDLNQVVNTLNTAINKKANSSDLSNYVQNSALANVNVGSATKLQTSRTFQTNLASTTAAGFDGTANNSHGVTGTLGVANGGTGQTSLANVTVGAASKATLDGAGNNIANTYLKSTGTAASATKLANSRTFQTNLASTVAAGFDGTANNSHGVTGTLPVANGGTGQTSLANVTVGAASKATLDGAGNNIASTYAKKSDLPDTSKMVTTDGNQTFTNPIKTSNDGYDSELGGLGVYSAKGSTSGYLQTYPGLGGCQLLIEDKPPQSEIFQIITRSSSGGTDIVNYTFKSDGIYLNGTKITN